MSEIKAVLLVPHEGDPHGLLREGPCGARPPRAWCRDWETDDEGETWPAEPRWLPARSFTSAARHALVLAWGGEPVPEGLDRLARSGWWVDRHEKIHNVVRDLLRGNRRHLRLLRGKGTVIRIDAEGRVVSDESADL